MRYGIAFAMGVAIAAVDNFAFGGETSPIAIFGLLFIATALIGFTWRSGGWLPATIVWACIPTAHLIKHGLGLPDTIQPNTYQSILKLAAVTLAVAIIGAAGGMAVGGRRQARSSG